MFHALMVSQIMQGHHSESPGVYLRLDEGVRGPPGPVVGKLGGHEYLPGAVRVG
jgi:hypothetical protein